MKNIEAVLNMGLDRIDDILDIILSEDVEKALTFKILEDIQFYQKSNELNESQTNRCIKELELAGLFSKDSDYEGMIGEAVKELLTTFEKQGHSGYSAPWVAGLFKRLVCGELLAPLTGEDDEWVCVDDYFDYSIEKGIKTYQNNRRSSVFKTTKEDGTFIEAHDIDGGPIFRDPGGCTYTSSDSVLNDIQFPYTPPERETIDVSE